MLTKTLVLATDLFCPTEDVGAIFVGLFKLERTAEVRPSAGEEGLKSLSGEEMGLEEDVLTTGTRGL